jgi:multidrug efflux pump subunit AcrA (membrane-fusion protein)
MNSAKMIAYPVGICLLLATLIGARQLTGGKNEPAPGAGAAAVPSKSVDGLVQKGTVAAEYDILAFYLPAHLPSGRVREILVKEGQAVKKGDTLMRFDDWVQQVELQEAEAAVQVALREKQVAETCQKQHAIQIQLAELAIKNAEKNRDKAKEIADAIKTTLQKAANVTGNQPYRENPDYLKAEGLADAAETVVTQKGKELELLKLTNPTTKVEEAHFQVQVYYAKAAKAKQALERCEVKADFSGVVEKVSALPGQVVYPQSRQPLFYIVPDGERLVKVEVVPEFAHKIRDKEQTKVVISDDSNASLTYEGIVLRVGSAFLPKTNGLDIVTGKPSSVLEVVVRVTDTNPAGKPPLRVGQPVRVMFR